jgi:hypothetical protein
MPSAPIDQNYIYWVKCSSGWAKPASSRQRIAFQLESGARYVGHEIHDFSEWCRVHDPGRPTPLQDCGKVFQRRANYRRATEARAYGPQCVQPRAGIGLRAWFRFSRGRHRAPATFRSASDSLDMSRKRTLQRDRNEPMLRYPSIHLNVVSIRPQSD